MLDITTSNENIRRAEKIMSEGLATVTLRDLASSGLLSKCGFSFCDEDAGGCAASWVGGDPTLLNAARLSLSLARLFARVCSGRGRGEDGASYSPSLTLDDFLVKLSNESSNGVATDETVVPVKKDVHPLGLEARSGGGLSESNDDGLSYLSMDLLRDVEMNSERNNETCIRAEGGRIDLTGEYSCNIRI